MPTAHCVSTTDGIILEIDRAFLDLVQRPESDVIGASYRTMTDPADLDRSARMLSSLIDRAPPARFQKRYLRPDGTSITANLYVTRFADPDRLVSTLFWNEHGRPLPPVKLWEAALRMRRMHSVRLQELGCDLATDPVGAMLTAIYLAEAEGRAIGLAHLAGEAGIAEPVAKAWLQVLSVRGLVEPLHAVRSDVQLSQQGLAHMERILASAYELSPSP